MVNDFPSAIVVSLTAYAGGIAQSVDRGRDRAMTS